VNPNRQVGVSANSAASAIPTAVLDVTDRVQVSMSNILFAGGKTEFDQTLKNLGAGAFDGTIYTPIAFTINSISNATVTVANADNAGTGQTGSPAIFYFRPNLPTGATSQTRHLVFNNPNTQLFIFNATVTARVQVDPASATRYEPEPPPDLSKFDLKTFETTYTGIVPASDLGLQLAGGVTYVDIPFTSVEGAVAVVGVLNGEAHPSTTGIDIDLHLRDAAGNVIARSESGSPDEIVSANIEPNRTYTYRVIGWAGVAQDFTLVSTQTALVPKASGGSSTSGGSSLSLTKLLQFTVNPLTSSVSVSLK
jgi:hypothetical protein